jgi:hypothetical protein
VVGRDSPDREQPRWTAQSIATVALGVAVVLLSICLFGFAIWAVGLSWGFESPATALGRLSYLLYLALPGIPLWLGMRAIKAGLSMRSGTGPPWEAEPRGPIDPL